MNFFKDVVKAYKIEYYQAKMRMYSRKIRKATMYVDEVADWNRVHDYYKQMLHDVIRQKN